MDTSETYIEMCQKAPKLLNEWRDMDLYVYPIMEKDCPHRFTDIRWVCNDKPEDDAFHIYKQDQLQEMIKDETRPVWYLVERFAIWCKSQRKDIVLGFVSMEQLWLAFVMKEKYGKIWDGTDWIKEVIR